MDVNNKTRRKWKKFVCNLGMKFLRICWCYFFQFSNRRSFPTSAPFRLISHRLCYPDIFHYAFPSKLLILKKMNLKFWFRFSQNDIFKITLSVNRTPQVQQISAFPLYFFHAHNQNFTLSLLYRVLHIRVRYIPRGSSQVLSQSSAPHGGSPGQTDLKFEPINFQKTSCLLCE